MSLRARWATCRCGHPHLHGDRAGLRLTRPRLVAYRTADRHPVRVRLNRSCDRVIGAYVLAGRRTVGVVWARSLPITPYQNAKRVLTTAGCDGRLRWRASANV